MAKLLISGGDRNFDNLIDKHFIGKFPCTNFLTINMLPGKIINTEIRTFVVLASEHPVECIGRVEGEEDRRRTAARCGR